MRLKLLTLALCLTGSLSSVALADNASTATNSNVDPEQVEHMMQKITAKTQQLEKQVNELQAELKTLKKQKQLAAQNKTVVTTTATTTVTNTDNNSKTTTANTKTALTGDELIKLGPVPVTTAPYIGVDPSFDPSTQIIYYSTYNTDVALLRNHQNMQNALAKDGFSLPDSPYVQLSGKLEPQAIYVRNYNQPHNSDINLASAEFDIVANMNSWVTGFAALGYDNAPPYQGPRTSNSRLFINKAFVILGNFNQSPFYATMGQRYVPFGHYSSNMITDPTPLTVFRTKARSLDIGYQPMNGSGVYATAFTFRGDSHATSSTTSINQLGGDMGYMTKGENWSIDFGGGALSNIADSDTMQNNNIGGNVVFNGFGSDTGSEQLAHRVAGINFHTSLGYGSYALIGEFSTASRRFSPVDMTFNGHGALPSALQVEAGYSFKAWGKPGNVGIAYNNTNEALALNMPKQRYLGVINMSFWKDTVESLELHHDIGYAQSDSATGNGGILSINGTGHASDTLTAQFGVYF